MSVVRVTLTDAGEVRAGDKLWHEGAVEHYVGEAIKVEVPCEACEDRTPSFHQCEWCGGSGWKPADCQPPSDVAKP